MLVVRDEPLHLLQHPFAVDEVPVVVRQDEADAGEELVRLEPRALHGPEVRVLLHRAERFAAHHVVVPPPAAAVDDVQVLELPKRALEADELDVRAPDVPGKVIVVTAVPGVVLQDGGQQHGGALSDGKALAYAPDVFVQPVVLVFGESFRLYLLVNAVQAGRQPRDRQGPGAPVLLVHLFCSSHPIKCRLDL